MSTKSNIIWSIEEVQNIIRSLPGFYGRLADSLDCDDSWEEFTMIINDNNCKNTLDIIMLIEGN